MMKHYEKSLDKVPAAELNQRMTNLRAELDRTAPEWRCAIVMANVNVFYLTGTMQNGLLIILRDTDPILWIKRSYERALAESLFPDIRPMNSFRDAAAAWTRDTDTVYLETEAIPLAHYTRLNKHFQFAQVESLNPHLFSVRAVKSAYELERVRRAGAIHAKVLDEQLPQMLHEGMTEVELATDITKALLHEGQHGFCRSRTFNAELFVGNINFGESALVGNPFNGPGGIRGFGPHAPVFGSRERKLQRGDIVSVDTACIYEGYHTDKTITRVFDGEFSEKAAIGQKECVSIQQIVADSLRPGNIPSVIYETVLASLSPAFRENFMGRKDAQVRFLGHGVGLEIDESPVLAKGFDEPLQNKMTIAIEPKLCVQGKGMVGIENTYIVTPEGGECVTGN